jgi:hypothetical protein
MELEIVDVLGQSVYRKANIQPFVSYTIDISSVSEGVLFTRLTGRDFAVQRKVLKSAN